MQQEAVEYCRHRERYLAMQRATANERTETADALRTVGGLLTDSMQRNGVTCLRVMQQNDTPNYIRLVPPRRRAKTLKTMDDVVAVLDKISADVADVPFEELPRALTRAVEERVRNQGAVVPAKVSLCKRVGIRQQVTELDQTVREIETLSTQLQDTYTERKLLRERIQPLRAEMKSHEETLLRTDMGTSDSLVQMRRADNPTAPPTTLRVYRTETVKRRNVFGLRNVCRCVREALETIPRRDEHFDATLTREVRRRLSEDLQVPDEPVVKIAVRRAPKGTLTR